MNDHPISLILSAIESVTGRKPVRNGRDTKAHCPAHDDGHPSLSVREADDGRVLVKCHAGCSADAVMKALGLELRHLMPSAKFTGCRTTYSKSTIRKYETATEAVDVLERQHGKRSTCWTYHDDEGNPIGVIVRWDRPDGKKDIRPISRTPNGWCIGGMEAPRPLYQLPKLLNAQRVYVTEGEKAADALISLGLVATTSPHGAKAARHANWRPLAGKELFILPDNDEPGQAYADDVLAALEAVRPAPTVKLVHLPDLPPGGDAFDYVDRCRTESGQEDGAIRLAIENLADESESAELESLEPAEDSYVPFPVSVLPEPLCSFVSCAAKAFGCDPVFFVLPILSILGSAIGNTRHIRLKLSWQEPPIIWTAVVAESGTLKTPAFKLVLKPLRALQDRAFEEYECERKEYEVELLKYDKKLIAWRRATGMDTDPPEKPPKPEPVRYLVNDTTVEALAPILLANWRGVLDARDELAGWIGSFDRYSNGKTRADASNWLSMHSAEGIIVDRKTGDPPRINVPHAAVSVTGGIQPGVLRRILTMEHRDAGLLARFLVAMPPRQVKRWSEAVVPPAIEAAYAQVLQKLIELAPTMGPDGAAPVAVTLTSAAKAEWELFYDEHANEQANLDGDLGSAWSKLEAYAARLALVIHFVRWAAQDLADPNCVDVKSVAAGIKLVRWFAHETERVHTSLSEGAEQQQQRWLTEWIRRRGGRVTVRDVTHNLRRYRRDPNLAQEHLDSLAEAGFGYWEYDKPGAKGGRPSPRLVLHGPGGDARTRSEDAGNGGFGGGVTENGQSPPSTGDHRDEPKDTGGQQGAAEHDDDDWVEL